MTAPLGLEGGGRQSEEEWEGGVVSRTLSPQIKGPFQYKKWSHFPVIGQAHIAGSSPLCSCGTSVVVETLFLWGPLVAGIPANMRLAW